MKSPHHVWICLACLGLCTPRIANSSTSVDICQEPTTESHLAIAYYDQEESLLEGNVGETNLEMYTSDLLFLSNGQWNLGVGHRSTILHLDRLALQTNGYLHTIFFPIHKLSRSVDKGFRLSIAPALSASSNVVSDTDEYSIDAMQLLAAAVWNRQMSDHLVLYYGVCGDHRLGEYQVYPVLKASWQVHPDWIIELGFPTSQITHEISASLSLSLRIAPNGNEWYVKDKSLTKHSQLIYEATIIEWAVNWRVHKNFALTASIGRDFHRRYEMTLLDEDRVQLSSDPATRFGLALAWYF